jgi:hypothetical protein
MLIFLMAIFIFSGFYEILMGRLCKISLFAEADSPQA